MADGRDINIRIKIDPDRVGSQAAQQNLSGIGREALRAGTPLKSVTDSFKKMSPAAIAAAAGIATAVTALAGITLVVRGFLAAMSKANSEFAPFQQGMRNVAAVSGATNEELRNLSTTALELASATRFNPQQVTEGLYALASAGQSVNEQLASLPGVLNFAEAAQADLGLATEITVGTLKVFGIEASEANRVVDVFTAAIANSSLNAQRLQIAMRQAGPAAKALNQDFESTTAALAILTSQFNSGELAGTGYRSMLNQLVQKQDELGIKATDSAGNMRPLVDIIRNLEERGLAGTEIMRILGTEAGPALAALLSQGSEALADMTEKIESNGQAAKVAAEQLDTLQGDQDQLASKIQEFWVRVGDVSSEGSRTVTQAQLEFMTSIVDFINENEAELRQFTSDISESIRIVTDSFRGFQPVLEDISPVLAIAASQIRALAVAVDFLVKATPELQAARLALRGLGSSDSGVDPKLLAQMTHAMNIALAELAKRRRESADAADEETEANRALFGSQKDLRESLRTLNSTIREHQEQIRKAGERIREAQENYREWVTSIDAVEDAFDGLDILDITELLEAQGRAIPDTAEGWRDLADAIAQAEAALDRYGSQNKDIPLDIEGELGGGVFPDLDPAALEDIKRQHEEAYGALAKELETVMKRAWENVQDIASDAIAEIVKTGKVDFENLFDSILDIVAQMLAKMLIAWLVNLAKRVAAEQAAAASSAAAWSAAGAAGGGGGGGGGWLSSLGSLFGGGGGGGGAAAGGIGGASWATLGTMFGIAAAAIIVAEMGNAFIQGQKQKLTAGSFGFDPTMVGDGRSGFFGGSGQGDLNQQMVAAMEALQQTFKDLEILTGATIGLMDRVQINVKGNGRIWVNIGDHLSREVGSLAEAMDLVVTELLRTAEITGASAAVMAALRNSAATTVDELQEELAAAIRSEELFLGEEGRTAIREKTNEFFELLEKELELGIIEAQGGSGALVGLVNSYQANFDRLMGITRDAGEVARQQAKAHNAALKMDIARLQVMRAELIATMALAQGGAGLAGVLGGGAKVMAEYTKVSASSAQVTGVQAEALAAATKIAGQNAQAQAALAQTQAAGAEVAMASAMTTAEANSLALTAIDEALAALEGLELDLDAAAAAARRAARGGGNRKADRERLQDILREHDLSKLSDLQQALQGVNDKWDDAIKLAHGDAEAIERVNRAREEEIQALKDQAVGDFYGRLRDFEKGPTSSLGDALSGVDETAKSLTEDARELAEALGFSGERLATMLRRIREAAQAQREIILGGAAEELLLSALDFLGRGEESERLRFEIQKAQLLIAYEELKVAAAKYKIELDLLATIGELIGEIIDLDFDAWKALQAPVRNVNRGVRQTSNELDRLADRLVRAKDNIRDFLNSLDRNELGGLSPKDALKNAMAQFQEVLKAARGGDINALEAFPSIGQDLLKIARDFYGSDPRFAEIFEMVRQAGIDLLGVSQAREGNVIFDERFYSQQRQQTTEQQRTNSLMEENNRLQQENQQLMRRLLAS